MVSEISGLESERSSCSPRLGRKENQSIFLFYPRNEETPELNAVTADGAS